ncbi:mobile mystery protein A [Paraburkholderia nemoris]|jgi:predicted DNA-binding mobile mystery protein A|uniref:Mobile mystery protein A n=3 Tax=Paraburkholderia TaxID=1822464 RepID=A0A6N6WDJ6_9BURK|nr:MULTISPECIES: mobile mystery protein A [Paraburkholderia]KAE8757988.1 mobile mystery protein A [Paraburkholderia madseniana]KPD19180.1 mobile mystery protein A [Burkholderia sp. ST111]MBK3744432.1 mobile mystery protein A [Paraburkholderia aspalathi]MBK3781024.1 mobile mystery protein A [Paraburkholderia aspalathi]MBK3808893.1 mobile mystery protein A [Paraburkholderia aspalathi]
MDSRMRQLRLEQVQASIAAYSDLTNRRPPPRGWLKAIRESLGLTERQQADRLGITGSTLHKSESAEAEERITLGQLRKLADGLDCELVYALVPRKPLTQVVEDQARSIALQEVSGVAHTMSLEDQRPATDRLRKQVEQRTAELLRGRWSDLWR